MSPTPLASSSATFYRDELQRALQEQTFGIVSFTLCNSSSFEATARVELLERVAYDISLNLRGYQARLVTTGAGVGSNPTAHFESLDTLLQHISAMYTTIRTETLIRRLST